MGKEIEESVVRFTDLVLSSIKKFAIVLKDSPLFLVVAIFTYSYLIYTGYYIFTSPTPNASLSEELGVISILIGLVGLLYTLYSAITSGKQLDQTLKDLRNIQIDYWNTRGIDQIKKKDFHDASQSYQMAININPSDVRIWINIAGSLFWQKKHDDALDAINRAIRINPERADAWNAKAMILREKAIALLENDIELDTEVTEIKFHKMAVPFGQNIIFTEIKKLPDTKAYGIWDDKIKSLLAQAEVTLRMAIDLKLDKINKNSNINSNWLDKESLAGFWSNLGTVYSFQDKYKKAINAYNKAIELNPGYIEVWMDKGHALLAEKRLIEAIDAFDKAIKIDPWNAKAWSGKGYTLKEMGEIYLKDAILAFDKAIEFDPFYFNAWSGKGSILFEIGNYDETIKVCDKALEINPFDIKMSRNKSSALFRLNHYEEAIKASDRTIKLCSQYAFSWYKEYEKLYVSGKYDEASRAYDRYLELMEENSTIHNIRGDAAFNSALRYPIRLWDALIAYNTAIILNPLDKYSWCCKSMVLYTMRFINESKKAYLRANRLAVLSATPYQYVEILPLEIDFWPLSIPEPNGPDLNDLIISDNSNYPNTNNNSFFSLYYSTYR